MKAGSVIISLASIALEGLTYFESAVIFVSQAMSTDWCVTLCSCWSSFCFWVCERVFNLSISSLWEIKDFNLTWPPSGSVSAVFVLMTKRFSWLVHKVERSAVFGDWKWNRTSTLKQLHVCSLTIWLHWGSSEAKLEKLAAGMTLFAYCQPGHTNSSKGGSHTLLWCYDCGSSNGCSIYLLHCYLLHSPHCPL